MTEIVKLELGCGDRRQVDGAVTIDLAASPAVDKVHDLNTGIPFDDASVDEIHSYHFLEHVENLEFILEECVRVLKPGGKLIGSVPHFANPYFHSDPTHKNTFGLYTFAYFSDAKHLFRRKLPPYSGSFPLRAEKLKLVFKSPFIERYPVKRLVGFFANLCAYTREFHEENLCYLVPPYEIFFILTKAGDK